MRKYLEKHSGIIAAMSDRHDGNMGFSAGVARTVIKNRTTFLKTLGLSIDDLSLVTEPHGSEIIVIDATSKGSGAVIPPTVVAEGQITSTSGVILGLTTADCFPIFFYDSQKHVIALSHAGWRSIIAQVVPKTLEKMHQVYQCRVEDVVVQYGAAICKDCFEIKDDVLSRFMRYPEHLIGSGGKLMVDLAGIITDQLLHAGVQLGNIYIDETCTMCSPDHYSYRGAGRQLEGLQLSVLTLL